MRICLVGAGAMGEIAATSTYASEHVPRASLVAVVDRDFDRAEILARRCGVRAFSTVENAIESTGAHAVDLRLPNRLHAESVREAAGRGLHILTEKPLCLSIAEFQSVRSALSQSASTLAVSENYPHMRSVDALSAAIAEGAIGDVVTFRTTRVLRVDGEWATEWRFAAGPLWDQGTHHSSLLRAVFGSVEAVGATSSGRGGDGEVAVVNVRTASGIVGQSVFAWGSPALPGPHLELEVFGTQGRAELFVDYDGSGGGARLRYPDGRSMLLSHGENYYDSHHAIVRDWCSAIAGGGQPRVSLDEAGQDVRFVVAALQSVGDGGRFVRLDDDALA
jgi:predicted dehydrogenase